MSQAPAPRGFNARLAFLAEFLVNEYGLPEAIASSYARYVLSQLGEPLFAIGFLAVLSKKRPLLSSF